MENNHIVGYCKICEKEIYEDHEYFIDPEYGLVHKKCYDKKDEIKE